MRKTTEYTARRIGFTLISKLDDFDFADELALLSYTHQHIQEKTNRQVGLKISTKKI